MASRKKTRHGASARARRTSVPRARTSARSSGGSSRRPAAKRSRRPAKERGPLILIAAVVSVALAIWAFYPVARLQYQEERQRVRLEAELEGLKQRNERLRAQVERLKTPEGVEEIARQDLGMVKEGENVYVVMEAEEPSATPAIEAAADPREGEGVVYRILDALFGFEE